MGQAALPAILAIASTVGTAVVAQATKPKTPQLPTLGDEPDVPSTDEAAMSARALLARQRRGLESLRIDPQIPSGTGLQIGN